MPRDFDTTVHIVTTCDTCGLTNTNGYSFHVLDYKGDADFMLSRMLQRLARRGAGVETCNECLNRKREIYV